MKERKPSSGWNYPVSVDPETGKIKATDVKSDIRQSILILLSTSPGERLFHPDYGCNLKRFMFEPISYELIKGIREEVYSAILKWERRIYHLDVDILNDAEEDNRLIISIRYGIKNFPETDSIFYAYDLQ